MRNLLWLCALIAFIALPAVTATAYDVEGEYVNLDGETITTGSYLATDRFGTTSGNTADIQGGQFDGRWLVYGSLDISGGDFNAVEVTKYEPDGTPYQAVQGGFWFRNSDDTAVVNITGGDFTGLVFDFGGELEGMRPWFNGEEPTGGQTTEIHIRGGAFADGQIMYGNYDSKTYLYGTDFQIETIEVAEVGIPVFPSYKPPTVLRSAAIISCTLEDGTPYRAEWRFWESQSYADNPERYFNFGTVYEVEYRYEERYDIDIEGFDGWGWFPTVDGEGNNTPYFALGDSFDGQGDDHWEGPLVLIDVSQQQEPIPEPATTALLGLGVLGGIVGARRRS